MGTCDFFHQWTQTHPSRTRGGRWGKGTGKKKKKNFSWRPGGWLECSPNVRVALQPREETAEKPAPAPLPRQGSFPRRYAPRRPHHLGADPAGAGGERPGGLGGRDADWGKRPVPPRRLPGSGGASEALVPSAAPGRRRGALLAVAAAGGGRAHGGAGPI